MRGVGTAVNVVTVVAGTAAGVAAGARLSEPLRCVVLQAVGLTTLVIGTKEALGTRNVVFPLVALIVGGALGQAGRLEGRLDGLGRAVRRRFGGSDSDGDGDGDGDRFVEGFVAASLLFCVGPLTVLGSLRDGLGGADHAQLLLVKSALDGLVAIALASTLGWGVGLSVLTIVAVQGSLTLGAGVADRVLTDRMVLELSATGGIMVLAIGLRLLEIRRVPVASFLPALVVAPVLVALFAS